MRAAFSSGSGNVNGKAGRAAEFLRNETLMRYQLSIFVQAQNEVFRAEGRERKN
jgi:hypothetical protein